MFWGNVAAFCVEIPPKHVIIHVFWGNLASNSTLRLGFLDQVRHLVAPVVEDVGAPKKLLPERFNWILRDEGIRGDHSKSFYLCLSDQHSVKWITMNIWQCFDSFHMSRSYT